MTIGRETLLQLFKNEHAHFVGNISGEEYEKELIRISRAYHKTMSGYLTKALEEYIELEEL